MFNIKADIGLPVSEKRLARAERREAEFNRLIGTRLAEKNREMVSNLITRGRQSATDGDLEQAGVVLDRALFLAEGSGLDTTDLYTLAKDTRRSLEIMQRDQAFSADMNSARGKLAEGDYLRARYFADLALARVPDSREARELTRRIDTAMEVSISRDQMVESRLVLADSLVSYGKFREALIAVRSLDEIAPDDSRVRMIVRKAEFGNLQNTAETALRSGDYRSATAALDRALELFPSHPWCLNLKARIAEETRSVDVAPPVPEQQAEPLSEAVAGQVDQMYRSGQRLFEQGNLQKAVERWERVERLAPGYLSVRRYLVDAYKFLGVELYTQNDLEGAVVVWKKASNLEPDNAEIANYIKRTEAEITRLEELSYEYR